jgi:hypothetical protein
MFSTGSAAHHARVFRRGGWMTDDYRVETPSVVAATSPLANCYGDFAVRNAPQLAELLAAG